MKFRVMLLASAGLFASTAAFADQSSLVADSGLVADAKAFGAREAVLHPDLSADGSHVIYITPGPGTARSR